MKEILYLSANPCTYSFRGPSPKKRIRKHYASATTGSLNQIYFQTRGLLTTKLCQQIVTRIRDQSKISYMSYTFIYFPHGKLSKCTQNAICLALMKVLTLLSHLCVPQGRKYDGILSQFHRKN